MPLSFREKRTLIKLLVISSHHVQHRTSWMEGKHLKALGPRDRLGFSGPKMKLLWKNDKLRWCECPSGLCTFVSINLLVFDSELLTSIHVLIYLWLCTYVISIDSRWPKVWKRPLKLPQGYNTLLAPDCQGVVVLCNTIKCDFFPHHDQG